MFDKFEKGFHEYADGYGNLRSVLLNLARWFYHNLITIAIFCSAIMIIVSAGSLILNARDRVRLGESKKQVVKVLVVSIFIFGAAGLVQLVNALGIKGL